ncbi:lantibiotic dehydratase [Streptomyces verrucosisporus]|uniref:lantibiotic dehydratase n=1 Tax=Streptomyces verrucosisporus TaxID=1695161 RepID=UPI0019CF80A6|nr:lantibiotic dehydratase [Streptomyces verrucosisporus]MBN3932626.1 lantibiotic dehydratase [Streptomyces verrucosisporus]
MTGTEQLTDTERRQRLPEADGEGFSPYLLFRRGTLAPASLDGLVPRHTWELLDRADRCAQAREELRGRLEDTLYAAVPGMPAAERRDLLRLRRTIHNDRPPVALPSLAGLPSECRELLESWLRKRAEGDRLLDEAAAALPGELNAGRTALAALMAHEDFQRGVQLSDEATWRALRGYAADPHATGRKPSRRRRLENTLTSFAYRVVFKPSPFGSFTEIGARPWDRPGAGGPVGGSAARRPSQVRLSVGLLSWMSYELRRLAGSEDLMRIRLNNSLVSRGDRVLCVRRPPDGANASEFGAAQVVSARNTELVRLLRRLLSGGDLTERALRDHLTAAGLAPDTAARTVDKLVEAGLCHRGLGLPDQQPRPAQAVAARLRALPGPQASECAEIFARLQAIEDTLAGADADERAGLLADVRGQVARFVELCGTPAPAPEAMRSVVFEDVGTQEPPHDDPTALVDGEWASLELFQRIVPVLDDASIEKAGLYTYFARLYGGDEGPVPAIEFYRAFAELTPNDAAAVATGQGDAHCDRLRELRTELLDELRAAAGRDGEVWLDAARLRAFADRLPASLPPWRSAAYRVQIATEASERLAVVNGVTTGQGVFFSRFCELLATAGPEGWSLADALRRWITWNAPRQTDLTAVLGLNFNLHPRLSPHELVYPGSIARPGSPSEPLTLADLFVRADHRRRRLQLVSARDGGPVDLVPLNFLYPAAAPGLYRFLCSFAPTRTYRGGLWEQLARADARSGRAVPPGPQRRPRVRLGGLVLDRASWSFPAQDIPEPAGGGEWDTEMLARFDRWRRAHGVPRHCFFRLVSAPPPGDGSGDVLEETRRWALQARSARLHKPHYLDSRNPFLLQVLSRQLAEAADGTVIFHECLPSPADTSAAHPPRSAEEFFVEYTLSSRRSAHPHVEEDHRVQD